MQKQLRLGRKLKTLRTKAGVSQFDLEGNLGLSHGSISKIESGKTNPTKETLLKIIDYLDIGLVKSTSVFNFCPSMTAGFFDQLRQFWQIGSVEALLDYAVQEVHSFVGFPASIIFTYNGSHIGAGYYTKSSFRCIKNVHKDEFASLLNEFSVSTRVKKNIVVQAFLHKQILHACDFRAITLEALPVAYSGPIEKRLGFLSGLLYPLEIEGTVFGVMLFINAEKKNILAEMPLTTAYAGFITDALTRLVGTGIRGVEQNRSVSQGQAGSQVVANNVGI